MLLADAENIQTLKKLKDWIRFAVSQFQLADLYYGHGTTNAVDEAVYLILHTLKLPADLPAYLYDSALTLQERQAVANILQQRIQTRKPSPYLTHESFFMGHAFYVDERVLIPRSPLAEIIEKHFQPWLHEGQIKNILDLCTGSGCIAISTAYCFPEAQIIGSDLSEDALAVAQINLKKHSPILGQSAVRFIQSHLFDQIPLQQFDIIISNPPYVDQEDMDSLPAEYLHEPALGLKAGNDGLDIIKEILANAKNYLTEHGILIIETGNSKQALIQQFPKMDFIWLTFEYGDSEAFLLTKHQLD